MIVFSLLTSDKLADVTENGIETTSGLAEDTLFYAQETEELDKSQIALLADKFNATVEEQLEDDYNMIDGIINNGSRKDLEKTRADLAESIEAAQTIADNSHIRKEMREMANEDIARLQGELAVVEKALSSLDAVNEERTYEEEVSEVQDWLLDMVADGKAEMSEDGAFRVNPDYYKELPRNDRHIESMTEAQAVSVMAALSNAGIEFSAAVAMTRWVSQYQRKTLWLSMTLCAPLSERSPRHRRLRRMQARAKRASIRR